MRRTEKSLIQVKSKGVAVDDGFGGIRRRSEDDRIVKLPEQMCARVRSSGKRGK